MTGLRVGHGYDVHRLAQGRPLILGGVTIPWEKGLDGHSDADVLTHAVMDALLGAAGLDDIGRLFPDCDNAFLNISSLTLLERVMKALQEFLRPEFIGRVDEIVVFNDLTPENLEQISNLMLTELVEPLRDKGIAFSWDESVPKLIASMSEGGLRGARDLRNNIRRQVEDKIANAIVDHASSPLSEVRALVEDGKVVIDAK